MEKGKTILKILGIIFSIIILIFLYSLFIGTKGLIVKEYKIVDNKLPSDFYGLKIVHASDIHYGFYYNSDDLKNLVDKVNKINPDIFVFTGDLIDINVNEEEEKKIIEILKEIKPNIQKYIIKGNLDYQSNNYENIIKKSDFKILDNSYDIIYSNSGNILISGLNSNLENPNINEKLETTYTYLNENEVAYKILLMHEPDYVDKINDNTFNLILAGHSHNGQVNLPIIGAIYTPKGSKKYFANYYQTKKGKLYISSGIGTSLIPIRLLNKPSINLYRLTNK